MPNRIDLFRPQILPIARQAMVDALTPDAEGRIWIGQGTKVDQFERELDLWVGTDRVVAVNSCTSALVLALRLAGIGPGDSVISTPQTCTATNMAILSSGAGIVWADVDPSTGNIDPWSVEDSILPNTKAVMAVDWGGYPVDLDELVSLCSHYSMTLIEDAAHSFGAIYKHRMVGSLADYTAFSFQAIKTLTTIEGGALTCINPDSYNRARLLRWYGINRAIVDAEERLENDIHEFGYKMNLTDPLAAMCIEQLRGVGVTLAWQRVLAEYYREHLDGTPGVTLLDYNPDRLSSCWLFTVKVKGKRGFISQMGKRGIQVSGVHKRNDVYSVFRKYRKDLPGVDEFDLHQVALPCHWAIGEKDAARVVEAVRECVKE